MKHHIKMTGCWLLAEVLTLFIDLTFSFSGHFLVRIVCAVCTLGIFAALMVQGGYSAAKADKKAHIRRDPLTLGIAGALIPVLLTAGLALSKAGFLADGYYRLYKLLCAPFLAVCNLFSADIVSASVPVFEIVVLFVLCLIPIPAAMIAYRMTIEGKSAEDLMYRGSAFKK